MPLAPTGVANFSNDGVAKYINWLSGKVPLERLEL